MMSDDKAQRRRIEALDDVSPRVVRISNALRVTELQLLIVEALSLMRDGEYEQAYALLDSARPTPSRGLRDLPAHANRDDASMTGIPEALPDQR